MYGNRLCDDQLCRCVNTENVKTLVTEIQCNHSNTTNGEREEKQSHYALGDRRNLMPQTSGEVVSLSKNCHPGNRKDESTSCEVRLISWTSSTSIGQSIASCCTYLTRTSKLRERQFIVAIYARLGQRNTSSWL